MSKTFDSIQVCDCGHQCESCGDCAYTEPQGDFVVVGRFCGRSECLAEVVDEEYTDAVAWRHQDGLVTFR